jgi:hypothetical protein
VKIRAIRVSPSFKIAHCFMAVVGMGLLWRLLRFGLDFEMSGDECNILNNVIPRSYAELLKPLDFAQVSPPLFLWATKLFDSIFRSDWGVRLLPFVAGLGALGMFWLLCRAVLQGTARWVAWAIFSVTYVPVNEASRAKGYTIDLLTAITMYWLTLRWLRNGRRPRELIWLAALAPIFVWFSYTSVFVIGAVSLIVVAKIFRERASVGWRNVAAALAFMGLAGASAICLYKVNIHPSLQVSQSSGLRDFWQSGFPPWETPWKIPLWLLEVHTGRGFSWPVGENHFGSTVTCVLWLTGLVVYGRRGNRWVWALFILPNAVSLAASFLHKYPYASDPRISMFLGPGTCLFMGAGVQYLFAGFTFERRRLCYRMAALLLLIVAVGGAARDVARRVREIKGPGARSVLVAASRIAGADGCFVVLPPISGTAAQVFTYYMKRYVSQPISWSAEIPSPLPSELAVAAARENSDGVETNLFRAFEKQVGKPMTPIWTNVAHQVLLGKNKDCVIVRIYQINR